MRLRCLGELVWGEKGRKERREERKKTQDGSQKNAVRRSILEAKSSPVCARLRGWDPIGPEPSLTARTFHATRCHFGAFRGRMGGLGLAWAEKNLHWGRMYSTDTYVTHTTAHPPYMSMKYLLSVRYWTVLDTCPEEDKHPQAVSYSVVGQVPP